MLIGYPFLLFKENKKSAPLAVSISKMACVHAQLCLTRCDPLDCVNQTLMSLGFSRQESWSGLPFPPPGDLPKPGVDLESPALAGGFFTTEPAGNLKE